MQQLCNVLQNRIVQVSSFSGGVWGVSVVHRIEVLTAQLPGVAGTLRGAHQVLGVPRDKRDVGALKKISVPNPKVFQVHFATSVIQFLKTSLKPFSLIFIIFHSYVL